MPNAPENWIQKTASLERDFEFDDFKAALAYVNEVGRLAEEANHHPDILIHGWNKVRLTLTTHDEDGLTDDDFKLASAINPLPSTGN